MNKQQTIRHTDRTRYFFDTEFVDDGKTIDLISIGIACSDGRYYYAVNKEAKLYLAGDWVKQNVIPQLPLECDEPHLWRTRAQIASDIKLFAPPETRPEFWAYFADYDWVAFSQIFGSMLSLPDGYPYFCMDLKQYSKMLGDPPHPKQLGGEHNALEDALWNKRLYEYLRTL